MNSSRVLKIALLIAIVILVSNAVAISRDYQDSWILEGLEIPFLLCVVTYVLAFFSEERVPLMVALAVVARCVFLAIPNLKYVWFQGTAIDQQTQYALADYVYKQGFIATQGPFGVLVYGSTPLIQLSLAMFSIVLNVQVVDSMKYLPVLLSPIYPLGTYVIVKNLKFSNSQSIMKYALFISSIPISIENYIVTGSQFGVLLAFFALTGLSMLVRRNDRRYLLVFVLSVFGLAVAHSPSSFLLTIFLLTALAIQRIPLSQMMSSLRVPVILAVTSICTTWLMFPARYTFETIVRLGFLRVQGEGAESVPPRFLELARVNMLGAFNTLLATDGAEIFLLLLASTGLIILLRTWKHLEKTSRSFLVVGATVFLFIPLGGLLSIGVFRIVFFASTLFPIFASILFVEYEGKRAMRLRKVVLPSIVLLILLSAALGLYGCQPLIPSASILLKDLPVDQPLGYVTSVNSIYQRQMIEFAQNNVAGQIACDSVTGDQITGLTDLNFSANHLTYYYPLDKKQPAKDYSYFLIHVPGIAGPFSNSAETRTRDMILTVINNSSNIYTNGESYILLNQTMVAQP